MLADGVGRQVEVRNSHIPPHVRGDESYAIGRSVPTWPTTAGQGGRSFGRAGWLSALEERFIVIVRHPELGQIQLHLRGRYSGLLRT
jgi:hypothetical protein